MQTRLIHYRETGVRDPLPEPVFVGRTAAARPHLEILPVTPAPIGQDDDAAGAGIGVLPGVAPGTLAEALLAWAGAAEALVAVKDIATGRYRHVDARMARFLGRAAEQAIGRTDGELFGTDAAASLRAADQFAAASGRPQFSRHRLQIDGRQREFEAMRAPLPAADGGEPGLLCVWTETTVEREREARLTSALAQIEAQQGSRASRQAVSQAPGWRDAVTGLHHDGHFDDQLRREVDLSSREHREFALVAMTLDAPSEAARALGGEARTAVLEALGRLVTGNTRAMDSSCRLAEDRFAILLSGVGLATAHARMEGLRRQCAVQIVMYRGQPLGFTLSMGVASFPHTAQTQLELSDAADAAMREAQRRGGNQVTLAGIRFEAV